MGYKLIGVNGYSKNKGEAHKLAQWLTNEENQLKRFKIRGFGPTNKNVTNMETVQNDTVISAISNQTKAQSLIGTITLKSELGLTTT